MRLHDVENRSRFKLRAQSLGAREGAAVRAGKGVHSSLRTSLGAIMFAT